MDLPKLVASMISAAAVLVAAPKAEAMMLIPCGVATDHYEKVVHPAHGYTVKPGDTLWDIARRFIPLPGSATGEGDPTAYVHLARQNGIADPDRIFVGQTIAFPERHDPPKYTGTLFDFSAYGFCPVTALADGDAYQHKTQIDTVFR